jgi:hypothetical protein
MMRISPDKLAAHFMSHWRNPQYLLRGSSRQRAAYKALAESRVLEVLAAFDPILVGSIPLEIDVESSDIDVICNASDLGTVQDLLSTHYGDYPQFRAWFRTIRGCQSAITSFLCRGFTLEVFSQDVPSEMQDGYRHMVVEDRLLKIGSVTMRNSIRALKLAGLGTEPAFARYLHLEGDPYGAILELSGLSDAMLLNLVNGVGLE